MFLCSCVVLVFLCSCVVVLFLCSSVLLFFLFFMFFIVFVARLIAWCPSGQVPMDMIMLNEYIQDALDE